MILVLRRCSQIPLPDPSCSQQAQSLASQVTGERVRSGHRLQQSFYRVETTKRQESASQSRSISSGTSEESASFGYTMQPARVSWENRR